jgi:hypothetical protein
LNSIKSDVKVFAWHCEFDYISGLHLARTAHRIFDCFPLARIGILGGKVRGEKEQHDKQRGTTHDSFLLKVD